MAKKTLTKSKISSLRKAICFIQFTHPGKEPYVSKAEQKAGWKGWNYGHHHRKFMKASGELVDSSGVIQKSDALYFWGEWEPDSKISPLNVPSGGGNYPHWLHEPYLLKTPSGGIMAAPYNAQGKQRTNTDPFVFELPFHYACCKQALLSVFLDRGSIVLFGSTYQDTPNAYFALDTVLVVDEGIPFSDSTWKALIPSKCSSDYAGIMGWDLTKDSWDSILYNGASFYNPVTTDKGNMYSFVPCKTALADNTGFERPRIDAAALNKLGQSKFKRDLITPNLNAFPRRTDVIILDNSYEIWDMVRGMIRDQGFEEGVQFRYNS